MPLSNPYLITSTHPELLNLSFVTSAHEELLNLVLEKMHTMNSWDDVKNLLTESKQINQADVLQIISKLKIKSPLPKIFFKDPWSKIEPTIDSVFDELNTDEYGNRHPERQAVKMIFEYIHDKWPEIASMRMETARRRLESRLLEVKVPI
jgi:hypothetical protein